MLGILLIQISAMIAIIDQCLEMDSGYTNLLDHLKTTLEYLSELIRLEIDNVPGGADVGWSNWDEIYPSSPEDYPEPDYPNSHG